MELSKEQVEAENAVMDPSNDVVILTGAAGTGKSTIIRALRARGDVTVCATTGKAAMNVGGITVDKIFGIDRMKWKLFNPGYTDWAMNKTQNTILIDEASMIGGLMSRLIYDTARSYGKRIILVGDWAQAPPVKDLWAFDTPMFKNAKVVKLTECHRQGHGAYLDALNKIRKGESLDSSVTDVFSTVAGAPMPDRDFDGVCMFATNARTNHHNEKCLREHMDETSNWALEMVSEVQDLRRSDKKMKQPMQPKDVERMIDDSNLAHGDKLAIGCKIVCTRNEPDGTSYVNGTVGHIVEIGFRDGRKLSEVQKEMEEVGDPAYIIISTPHDTCFKMSRIGVEVKDANDEVQYLVTGFPIKLGYALTIHKAQGATVDNAWVDMDSLRHFPLGERHGLAYVALSRTRELKGLQLSEWAPDVVECNDITRPWL